VIVQTYSPDHPAIRRAALHDFVGFAGEELPYRAMFGVPPYGRLVRVIARGPHEAIVQAYMNVLGAAFREAADPSVRILGPAAAPIVKIRNLYRFHLQLRCPKSKPLQVLTAKVPAEHPAPAHVEVAIDVDAISML
jgi:primosomal protein N' (replication factor Y)